MSEPVDLLALCLAWAKAASEDLSGLVGSGVRFKPPKIEACGHDEVAGGSEHIADTVCRSKENADDSFHVVVPRAVAVTMAGVLMGFPQERVEELRAGGLDEESLDAYGEVMNLAISVLGRVFQETGSLPALQRDDTTEIIDPGEDPSWIQAGRYRVIRFALVLEGYPEDELRLVMPQELAERWFGVLAGEEDDSDPEDAERDHDGEEDDGRPIALLDPDEDERASFEEFEEDLGRPVLTLDPAGFEAEMIEELAESGAIVLAWDLGGRSGLELLETLRNDDRTRRIPIALASEAPTEPMVASAIHYGAATFLHRPYEMEEVRRRLFPNFRPTGGTEAQSAESGDESGDTDSEARESPSAGETGSEEADTAEDAAPEEEAEAPAPAGEEEPAGAESST